ncbi:MAG: extracellular solute-binding protein, partial [Eubacteriales bacterium]|nr:extracellular solute-binding protein [Eubacteriales bacterium]
NSSRSIDAFTQMTDMYTKYKVTLKMDMLTRFRTGETPIVITGYTFYNSLIVGAPEINGLWEFCPIPGTLQPDGTIRREVGTNLTATVLMKNAKDKDSTWEFMKWWTSSETQVRYGREMESIQGASARWPTANLDAMNKLPWPTSAAKAIAEQWKWVKPVPEIPGSYMLGRYLDNAIRSVINNGTNPRETLLDWVDLINDEIALKRREFGME